MFQRAQEIWREGTLGLKITWVILTLLIIAFLSTNTVATIMWTARKQTIDQQTWGWSKENQACNVYCGNQCKNGKCINARMRWVHSAAVFREINYCLGNEKKLCRGRVKRNKANNKAASYNTEYSTCTYGAFDTNINYCNQTPGSNKRHLCACNCKK